MDNDTYTYLPIIVSGAIQRHEQGCWLAGWKNQASCLQTPAQGRRSRHHLKLGEQSFKNKCVKMLSFLSNILNI